MSNNLNYTGNFSLVIQFKNIKQQQENLKNKINMHRNGQKAHIFYYNIQMFSGVKLLK